MKEVLIKLKYVKEILKFIKYGYLKVILYSKL